ncbi:hypothetical protein GCM10011584_14670 [Nocardioides phosphati]|uniref:Uncharacterized protein n=1 Tax=Nocardioides phosphati TaxID=1867775 RepID=A0ABQ2N9H0_9ACTN|nr:hypothetical protein [Nocardioides phosphati]GGO88219.1 hypothetical protein GCM10011584_14670 [Nocardioides phosphati]
MPSVTPLPLTGEIYLDARSPSRALRVTWHHEAGLVVLSLWRDTTCAGTFRLAIEEVPDLIDVLRAGLDASYAAALGERRAARLSGLSDAG